MKQTSSPLAASPPAQAEVSLLQQPGQWWQAFWQFSRPHTIVGTTLSVVALAVLTVAHNQPWGSTLPRGELAITGLMTLLACLCGNVYIVGLNQLEDAAIDRINKPHLPIASGAFSLAQAQAIVRLTGSLAILLAASQGIYLLAMVAISLGIGTAYSLPPLRLKRFPLWASLCIFTVRGVVVNLGLFLHFQATLLGLAGDKGAGRSLWPIPPVIWALTGFILVFTFAIAIFKDIPDAEGDRHYGIATFTLSLGRKNVFNLARWVLTICYVGMAIAGIWGGLPVNALALAAPHLSLLALFWWRSFTVDLDDKAAVSNFYQFIWKLFFSEYLLFPLVCIWP